SIAEAPILPPIDTRQVYPAVPPGGTEPEIIERPMPPYPLLARRAGIEGTVILRAIVRKSGSVDSVQILRDLPFGLGEAARDAVEHWRFRPATYNGEPIDVYYTVTVNYRLTD
ncbi:MAG TPA: energy transducer TonB, partial [Thermoanaerobaculia bacterium]